MYGKRTHFFHKPVESYASGFGRTAQRNVNIRNLANALRLIGQQQRGIVCHVPSHAYFEYVVACVTHFKREPHKLREHSIPPEMIPNGRLEVVKLDSEYWNHLLRVLSGKPYPDLKSQDLIYFCIACDRGLTLISEDKKQKYCVSGRNRIL
jgi:hypothetical protein